MNIFQERDLDIYSLLQDRDRINDGQSSNEYIVGKDRTYINHAGEGRGGVTGRALISNQYIDCTQAGQIPAATRQLGPSTIAYSISETAFTIQFGGYQLAPIPYLGFA